MSMRFIGGSSCERKIGSKLFCAGKYLTTTSLWSIYMCVCVCVCVCVYVCVCIYIHTTFNIQKTKTMASGPITSWQIDGETMETVTDFILWGSKITADGDCSHKIKRHLLLGRKVMTNLDSILWSRNITLPTKVCLVKAFVCFSSIELHELLVYFGN